MAPMPPPATAVRMHSHEGKERIQLHRGRQRHRQVNEQAHQNTAKGRNQTGGHKDGAGCPCQLRQICGLAKTI